MDQARKQSRAEAEYVEARLNRWWRFLGVFSAGLFALVIALTLLQCSISTPQVPNRGAAGWSSTSDGGAP
jgi:hypothetical protein